ncbi:hypothetical protein CPB84DRAFT_330366 [Gymnopilus junonius]|uniref:Protein kinase domain-containing protein n=1 Tax=Gymnopilus junonius TaxID=109634 RepID=A0A9P5THZ3_GYMJU|nr:hypothetical protein CPB84DRAFT_330366 [Gymnopilus junonius]
MFLAGHPSFFNNFDVWDRWRNGLKSSWISQLTNEAAFTRDIEELIKLSKFSIGLTDFGTAATVDGRHANIIQPYALRAPEVIIGCGWDTRADIWNLGCLIFELLTGWWLFVPRKGPTWTAEAYHLAHMPAVVGDEYDISYIRKGKHYMECFTDDGTSNLRSKSKVNFLYRCAIPAG